MIVERERELGRGPARRRAGRRAAALRPSGSACRDRRIAALAGATEEAVRAARAGAGVRPVYKRVDTCAAEFEAHTPYLYSTYEDECEARGDRAQESIILGGGPNRIGQGIEFDYCCVPRRDGAARGGLRDDHGQLQPRDGVDRLRHLRPAVLRAAHARGRARGARDREQERHHRRRDRAVRRADPAQARGAARAAPACRCSARRADAIDRAEDRERFGELLAKLGAARAALGRRAHRRRGARGRARDRLPGDGAARATCWAAARWRSSTHDEDLDHYMRHAVRGARREHPLLDRPVPADAVELDVDVVADRTGVGRSAASWSTSRRPASTPATRRARCRPTRCPRDMLDEIQRQARACSARELGVVGLMNMQFAVHGRRRLRARGQPARLAHGAVRVQGDRRAAREDRRARRWPARRSPSSASRELVPDHVSVKEAGVPVRQVRGRRHHPRPGDAHRPAR